MDTNEGKSTDKNKVYPAEWRQWGRAGTPILCPIKAKEGSEWGIPSRAYFLISSFLPIFSLFVTLFYA